MTEMTNHPDITNHCLNSAAAVRFGILKEANVDDFYVIRQAEVSSQSYQREVATYDFDIESCDRRYATWMQRIDILKKRQAMCRDKHLGWLFTGVRAVKNGVYKILRLPHEDEELFGLEMNVRRYHADRPQLEKARRDARMQLEAALQEKAAFYERHPEFSGKTYEEVQEEMTERALLNRIAVGVAASVWGGQLGAAATAMLELSPEQLQYVIRREHELRANLEGYQFNAAVYQILQEVKPEDREQFLISAAQLARPYTIAPGGFSPQELQQMQAEIQGNPGVIVADHSYNPVHLHRGI
jgi:hypothetical protein